MTYCINQLYHYAIDPSHVVEVESDLHILLQILSSEVDCNRYDYYEFSDNYNEAEEFFGCNFELRYLERSCEDGRRVWEIAILYFKGLPFGLYQCAGRDGRDYTQLFIEDEDVFSSLLSSLESYRNTEPSKPYIVIGAEEEFKGLTEFYGGVLELKW